MDKTLCQKCFHYEACCEIDLSGSMGHPESENEPCDHFIDSDRVKIQDKANWIEEVKVYGEYVHICYHCSSCDNFWKVKGYDRKPWDDYFHEHYQEERNVPEYCEMCGSEMVGIIQKEK